jgi:hypothetical protein
MGTSYNSTYNNYNIYYALTADIDLDNRMWTPIGQGAGNTNTPTLAHPFRANFDGRGYTISNYILVPSDSVASEQMGLGIFGFTNRNSNATTTIKNLYANSNISISFTANGHCVGGIAGYGGQYTNFENCHFSGSIDVNISVSADCTVGGVLGYFAQNISNCSNSANITYTATATNSALCVAGLVGGIVDGTVRDCFNTGEISVSRTHNLANSVHCYGLVKECGQGIVNSGNIGDIKVSSNNLSNSYKFAVYAYGLCQSVKGSAGAYDMVNCFNSGNVVLNIPENSDIHIAGLASWVSSVGSTAKGIINCYSSGGVIVINGPPSTSSSSYQVFGLVTYSASSSSIIPLRLSNCYWPQNMTANGSGSNQSATSVDYSIKTNCSQFDASGIVLNGTNASLVATLNSWVETNGGAAAGYSRWVGSPYPTLLYEDYPTTSQPGVSVGYMVGSVPGATVAVDGGAATKYGYKSVSNISNVLAVEFNSNMAGVTVSSVGLNTQSMGMNYENLVIKDAEPASYTVIANICRYKIWYTDQTQQIVNIKITQLEVAINLTARAAKNDVSLSTLRYSFKAPDGSGTKVITEYAQANEEAEILPIGYTYPGYTQKGWTTTQGSSTVTHAFGATYTATDDLTLYPVWARDVGMVTLQYTGGIGPTNEFADLISSWYFSPEYEKTMQLPSAEYMTALSKAAGHDMKFMGWYTDEALADAIPLTSGKYLIPSNWTGDKIVYGKWS